MCLPVHFSKQNTVHISKIQNIWILSFSPQFQIVFNFASYQAVKIVCGRKRVNLNWKDFTGLEIQDKLFQFLSPVTTLGNSLISSVI